MPIDYAVLKKEGIESTSSFQAVERMAVELHDFLNQEDSQADITELHVLGAPSAVIQEIVLKKAHALGFEDEKKGLFSTYEVSALRPDYFCRVGDAGILLEVERGKTIANNMDLLDLWKCHICHHASFLFLVVPKVRPDRNDKFTQQFSHVRKRLAPFFEPRNYVNVDAVFLFGY